MERPVLPKHRSLSVQLLQSHRGHQWGQISVLLLGFDVLWHFLLGSHDGALRVYELLPQEQEALCWTSCSTPPCNDPTTVLDILHAILRVLHINSELRRWCSLSGYERNVLSGHSYLLCGALFHLPCSSFHPEYNHRSIVQRDLTCLGRLPKSPGIKFWSSFGDL